jgi:digeranylgeranylglycerophospholipid reductase
LEKRHPIIVIGGSSCGSFSAFSAAKAGADTIVFEEHEAIGVPSYCAGHLSLSGLKCLGLLPLSKKVVENEFRNAVFYSPSGKEFSVRFSSPVTCVVHRESFDQYVAELAMKTGVQYHLGARVESLVLENNLVKGIVVSHEGKSKKLTSNIVIDAEGISSNLLKRAGLPTLNRSAVVNAVHAEVDKIDDVESDEIEVYLGRQYAPGFYAWIMPKRDGSAKIGLATKMGNPKKYLQEFMHNHPIASKKLKESKIVKESFHPITLGGAIHRTYHNGLLIVGDAASQVKPTTGGGLIFGLLCSKIAGEVAAKAAKDNDYSAEFLSQYQSRWKRTIGFELAVMRYLRLMLNRLSDKEFDKLIALCSKFEVGKILEECGDLDFEGTSLIKMLRRPTTFAVCLTFLLSSVI